jgi:DNA-binding IclR family transcriptional regulator
MFPQEKNPKERKNDVDKGETSSISSSLRRATEILFCLSNDINTPTDIANYCLSSVSTVHRILRNLKDLGWATQDGNNHRYYLGPLIVELAANRVAAHKYLIIHARQEMTKLSNATEETVFLAVMVQLHPFLLLEIPSHHDLRVIGAGPKMVPSYAGASSKTLLSQLDDNELKKMIRTYNSRGADNSFKMDKKEFMKQINMIRQHGFGVSYGERIRGSICVAAPVNNYPYPAVLGILGPEERVKEKLQYFISECKASAKKIANDIIIATSEDELRDIQRLRENKKKTIAA